MDGVNGAWALSSKAPAWEVALSGSRHLNFTDLTYVPFLRMLGLLGAADGSRLGFLYSSWIEVFFARHLSGDRLMRVPGGLREVAVRIRNE